MSIIYLAGPYSKGESKIRLARFNVITFVAAKLIEQKKIVFSPLTMTHPIDLVLAEDGATLGSDYWVNFDEKFMECCSEIYVLKLPGWQESSGVKREIQFFEDRDIKVKYISPDDYCIDRSCDDYFWAFNYENQ